MRFVIKTGHQLSLNHSLLKRYSQDMPALLKETPDVWENQRLKGEKRPNFKSYGNERDREPQN